VPKGGEGLDGETEGCFDEVLGSGSTRAANQPDFVGGIPMMNRIVKAAPLPDHTVLLFFESGHIKLLDMEPYIDKAKPAPSALLKDLIITYSPSKDTGTGPAAP
jgi:hypothetical protein